jgi:hypothetical protein
MVTGAHLPVKERGPRGEGCRGMTISTCSLLLTPGRIPPSTSACTIQRRTVSTPSRSRVWAKSGPLGPAELIGGQSGDPVADADADQEALVV